MASTPIVPGTTLDIVLAHSNDPNSHLEAYLCDPDEDTDDFLVASSEGASTEHFFWLVNSAGTFHDIPVRNFTRRSYTGHPFRDNN